MNTRKSKNKRKTRNNRQKAENIKPTLIHNRPKLHYIKIFKLIKSFYLRFKYFINSGLTIALITIYLSNMPDIDLNIHKTVHYADVFNDPIVITNINNYSIKNLKLKYIISLGDYVDKEGGSYIGGLNFDATRLDSIFIRRLPSKEVHTIRLKFIHGANNFVLTNSKIKIFVSYETPWYYWNVKTKKYTYIVESTDNGEFSWQRIYEE